MLADMAGARTKSAKRAAINKEVCFDSKNVEQDDWGLPLSEATTELLRKCKWIETSECEEASVVVADGARNHSDERAASCMGSLVDQACGRLLGSDRPRRGYRLLVRDAVDGYAAVGVARA